MIRYPAGPVTPHGWYHLTKGDKPLMWLDAYDKSIRFDLLGGLAAPYQDPDAPEAVAVVELKGLIPPWKHIQQKGATQDGITHVDALLDPAEVQMVVESVGRDWKWRTRIDRHLVASIDAIKQSRLNFFTFDMGHWWADVRWFQGGQADPMKLKGGGQRRSLRLQVDKACWQSYDNTDIFTFVYDAMTDTFDVDNTATQDLGDVPQYYTGAGGGYCTSDGDQMIWVDDPGDPTDTQPRRVINGPWPDFDTETDNQVISQVHAWFGEWSLPESSRNIIGGRMGADVSGDWDGSGVFVEYGIGKFRLFYTIDFVETTLWEDPLALAMWIPPLPSEKFTLVCGYGHDPRMFKVLRNGVEIMAHKEVGTGSPLGASNRGVGNGMHAAGALITQATPAAIRKISAGDNAEASQDGFLTRINVGDQKMYDDYTLFGPATAFRIYDGPGSAEYVEFGPLLNNQIVFLRTDPRSNTTLVQDLTAVPPSPQELDIFQDAVDKFLTFAGMNQTPFGDQLKSMFGIRPPQGNLYKYLNGRFSERCAIPPKSPGQPAENYFVKVEIVGGNADSKIIASGTPLRRNPL